MSTVEQLLHASASALRRSPWEVQKFLTYLQEVQLLRFAKDAREISLDSLVAWGVPARLALEIKYQSGIFSKRPILLYAVYRWLDRRGKRKDMDEWSVSSDDFRYSSFRLEPPTHTRAKDSISRHIQVFLTKFRLRRKSRLDAICPVADWLSTIAGVLERPADEAAGWRKFLVKENWLRTVGDVRYVPESLWEKWSSQGRLPMKVALMLRKLETVNAPSKFPVLPSTVKRSSAGTSTAAKNPKTAALRKSISGMTASTTESPVTSEVARSSLQTLQDKLLEFTSRQKEEEPSWLVRNFQARVRIGQDAVDLSFNRRHSRWFLEAAKAATGDRTLAVHLLAVSKVARPKDENRIILKYREGGDSKEVVLECGVDDCQTVSKTVRRVINWVREQQTGAGLASN